MPKRIITYLKTEFGVLSNGKAFVFLICLFLATFLWFLNALEKHYTDRISVPVKYINLPKDKNLMGKLPNRLELTVDGFGYTLLQHKLSFAFSPILLDVNDLTNSYLENRLMSRFTISTMGHKEEIAKQISSEIEIISIRPDSISFYVSNIVDKLIRVRPDVQLTFSKEYILQMPPLAQPEFIWVRGPEDILDTLKFIQTNRVVLNNLSGSADQIVNLKPIPELKFKQDEVQIKVEVEQFTEAKFEIPVTVINQPTDWQIKTFPSSITVRCRVGLSHYGKLSNNSFSAVVNYANQSASDSKLMIQLDKKPLNIVSVDYSPKEVDFVIEKKD